MVFSEDSRVKIPCILHLVRLGYRYLSLKNAVWDEETNIFPDLFRAAIARINPGIENDDIDRLLADVKLSLDNEDLGKAFYEELTECSGTRLIDFADFANNSFHVVTELTCKNGDDEFRPDITLLINGMPLIFVEVKKPNNREGVLAERNRIITRCRNARFRRFINATQLMVFSNNMEYDDGSPQPIEGAFYASPSYDAPSFNYFREEEVLNLAELLADEDDAVENEVLRDNNLNVIKHSPEFISNKSPGTPTNRICTSLFSRDRLSFLLQYALVYVNEADGLHKHIMRYPQLFATKAIERKLDAGVRKGIIWHTQGSGKTALAVADLLGGGTPTKKKSEYWNGDIPFFTPTDADGIIFKFATADYITEEGLKGSSTKLFGKHTVFITARGSVGKLVLAGVDMAMNQSCYALRAKPSISHIYLFFLAKELIHHLQVKSSGSVFDSIVSNDIELTSLAIPERDVVKKFAAAVEPTFEKIANNTKENQHLTQLRDWLLPMLMNGQVTVA